MAYTKNTLIYILTPKASYIPPLRQNGPIVNPLKVPCRVVEQCLQIGVPISEYDEKTQKVVKLTPLNLYDDEKFAEVVKESPHVSTHAVVKESSEEHQHSTIEYDAVQPMDTPLDDDKTTADNIGNFNDVHSENKNDKKKYRRDYNKRDK